jgi:hypothetical protein
MSATWRIDADYETNLVCCVCTKPITNGQFAIDMFAKSTTHARIWAHNDCVRGAMERWIEKKETKA